MKMLLQGGFVNLKLTNTKLAILGMVLLAFGASSAFAGTVVLTGATGNTCSSYSNFSVDTNGNLTVNCSGTNSPTPTQAVVPSCTLIASPATISPGASSTLTASCSPAATSYIWTGPGMNGISTASARGTVSPTGTTPYSVTGVNSAGTGNTDTKFVTVSTPIPRTGRLPAGSSPLDEIKAWNYAFETLNHIPHNFKWEPVGKMNYYKVIQANKPTIIHLPTSW